ncbi:hypothetical protein [Nocardioides sp.]|uniref:hypothetical protein n=1 Tax=Nocardioides sp. TaxID=35761 RepID=UPI0035193DEE
MSASAVWTVHCDGSEARSDHCHWWVSQADTQREANAMARRCGWKVGARGEPNLCPECRDTKEAERAVTRAALRERLRKDSEHSQSQPPWSKRQMPAIAASLAGAKPDDTAVLAERDARVKAEGIAEGLSVAAAFLREQFDYWDGRPLAMHGPHLWSDFRAVLDAIERRAERNREGQA